MRSRQNALVGLLVVLALAVMVGSANATFLVTDSNLLSGKSVAVSSSYGGDASSGTFGCPSNLDNGLGGGPTADFIFQSSGPADPQQRVVIHGFDSAVSLVRIWSGSDLPPARVCIKSSTTDISPSAADFANAQHVGESFETLLHDMADISYPSAWTHSGSGVDNMDLYYTDIAVNASAGTKSLYFDFGADNPHYPGWGACRVSEIQAFASVPEPSTLVLLAGAIMSLAAYAWRKHR
jgi:hypothetical protein